MAYVVRCVSFRSVPTTAYCKTFAEIALQRHLAVDVCLSFPLCTDGPHRSTWCSDLTGATIDLRFASAAESRSLREALLRARGRLGIELCGPEGVTAWLVARQLLVLWSTNGQIRCCMSTSQIIMYIINCLIFAER